MRDLFRSLSAPDPMPEAAHSRRFDALAKNLETLASSTRLEILHALRAPRALHEIRVTPSLSREGESDDRPLSRQAVSRHLEVLLDAGLVRRIEGGDRARGDGFVLSHERLFAVVDEMRSLAKLRPLGAEPSVGETVAREGAGDPRLPDGPRLLVAFGRDDGLAFPLASSVGSRSRIGRAPACEVRLDYDPFLSSEHAAVERAASGFVIHDLASRNGTLVNWAKLPSRGSRALAPGDLLTVGRTVLAFQPG